MIVDNINRIKLLKKVFYLVAVVIAIVVLVFVGLKKDMFALVTGVLLVLWFVVFQVTEFMYIQFSVENGKVTLRYYPAVKFGHREYNAIEFPENTLHNFNFEKSFFGLVRDLTLMVRTKRGIAEYPSISLAATNKAERKEIEEKLREILIQQSMKTPVDER